MFYLLVRISPVFSAAFMFLLNAACAYYLSLEQYAEYVFYVSTINATAAIVLLRTMDFKLGKYARLFSVDDLTSAGLVSLSVGVLLTIVCCYYLNLNYFTILNVLTASVFLLMLQRAIFEKNLLTVGVLRSIRGAIICIACVGMVLFSELHNINFVLLFLIFCNIPSFVLLITVKFSFKFFRALTRRKFLFKFLYRNFSYIVDMLHLPLFFYALMKVSDSADLGIEVKLMGLMVPVIGVINQVSSELLRAKSIRAHTILQYRYSIFFASSLLVISLLSFVKLVIILIILLGIVWLLIPFSGYMILERNRETYDVILNVLITIIMSVLFFAESQLEYFLLALISKYSFSIFIALR